MTHSDEAGSVAEAAGHAIDFVATGGFPIRRIREDPEIMAILDTKMTETGFTIGDHVRCCITELDKFEAIENHFKQV